MKLLPFNEPRDINVSCGGCGLEYLDESHRCGTYRCLVQAKVSQMPGPRCPMRAPEAHGDVLLAESILRQGLLVGRVPQPKEVDTAHGCIKRALAAKPLR